MQILKEVGVCFHAPEAIDIFKEHGVKADKNIAFLDEDLVAKALQSVPSRFEIAAREPSKSVDIGKESFIFAPGYGAAFIVSSTGEQRDGTLADYNNFCRLVQTSKYIDMNGFLMIEPLDIPREKAHLDMLYSSITHCDKAFMGSPLDKQAAKDSIEMAAIVWEGKHNIKNKPVMLSNINTFSPLRYSSDMAGALIEFVRWGQPVIVTAAPIAGATGPITLSGILALINAEILAGVTLSQLVNPGVPVVYGVLSCPMDLRRGSFSCGGPELSMLASAGAQIAKFYGLPSRGGGALTDAQVPDIQAGVESAIALTTSIKSGVNFMFLAGGILGACMAMSYEKFLVDEELCGMVRRLMKPIDITDLTTDLATIKEIGIGGHYLAHPNTLERCRTEFFLPDLFRRQNYQEWKTGENNRLDQSASHLVKKRLAEYEPPELDSGIKKTLQKYIAKRKNV